MKAAALTHFPESTTAAAVLTEESIRAIQPWSGLKLPWTKTPWLDRQGSPELYSIRQATTANKVIFTKYSSVQKLNGRLAKYIRLTGAERLG